MIGRKPTPNNSFKEPYEQSKNGSQRKAYQKSCTWFITKIYNGKFGPYLKELFERVYTRAYCAGKKDWHTGNHVTCLTVLSLSYFVTRLSHNNKQIILLLLPTTEMNQLESKYHHPWKLAPLHPTLSMHQPMTENNSSPNTSESI